MIELFHAIVLFKCPMKTEKIQRNHSCVTLCYIGHLNSHITTFLYSFSLLNMPHKHRLKFQLSVIEPERLRYASILADQIVLLEETPDAVSSGIILP